MSLNSPQIGGKGKNIEKKTGESQTGKGGLPDKGERKAKF